MRKSIVIKGFTTRIHDVCGKDPLREWMQNIFFHDGKIYATNSHLAVRIPLERFNFEPDEINLLNGRHITAQQFALMFNKEIRLSVSSGKFEIDIPTLDISVHTFNTRLTFEAMRQNPMSKLNELFSVDCKSEGTRTPLLSVGFMPAFAMTIAKALGTTGACKFYFSAQNKPIIVEAQDETKPGLGFFMPVTI
jgi:hypothetical protein